MASARLPVLLFLVVLAWAAPARANFDMSGVYIPVGVNLGAGIHNKGDNGFLLGGEVSFLRFWHHNLGFAGGYADYLHDFGAGTHRVSLGPEGGLYFAGLDAGPVIEWGGGRTDFGARARVLATVALLSVYVGEQCRLTSADARWTTEIGVLLKFPIGIATCSSKHCAWGQW
jgi:hypothetical protein